MYHDIVEVAIPARRSERQPTFSGNFPTEIVCVESEANNSRPMGNRVLLESRKRQPIKYSFKRQRKVADKHTLIESGLRMNKEQIKVFYDKYLCPARTDYRKQCECLGMCNASLVHIERDYTYSDMNMFVVADHYRGGDSNFLVNVEENPGPTNGKSDTKGKGKDREQSRELKKCSICGAEVSKIIEHLKAAHPRGPKTGGDDVSKSLSDEMAKAKGIMDAGNDKMKEAKQLLEDLQAPAKQAAMSLDEKRAIEELESFENQRRAPDVPLPQQKMEYNSSTGRAADLLIPGEELETMVIGELKQSELPGGIFFSSYWARLYKLLFIFLLVQAFCLLVGMYIGIGPVFNPVSHVETVTVCDTTDGERLEYMWSTYNVEQSKVVETARLQGRCESHYEEDREVLAARYTMVWFRQALWFILVFLYNLPIVRGIRMYIVFAYYMAGGRYFDGIWLLVFEVVRACTVGLTLAHLNKYLLGALYYIVIKFAKFYGFLTGNVTARCLGRYPTSLSKWLSLPMEKIKHIRLVLVPKSERREARDWRPEFDRGDMLAKQRFNKFHVRVEVRTDAGYRYYKDWVSSLPKFWYKENQRTLKVVNINKGLMATALNRKTLLGSRASPEVAIDTMLRLMSSNPHYEEDLEYMRATGGSVYRDMAMVFGAVVSRDCYFPNEHF